MKYLVVGLGNPGKEYEGTRHNVGKMLLDHLFRTHKAEEWREDKKLKTVSADFSAGKDTVALLFPLTMMNNSGKAVGPVIKSKKDLERLVVVHDDLDLPLGRVKISYGRGSGGHRGLDSIMRALKSRDFVRVRIGISSATPSGKLRKPTGEKAVIDFILGKFKPDELEKLKKEFKKIAEAIEAFVKDGRQRMMSEYN